MIQAIELPSNWPTPLAATATESPNPDAARKALLVVGGLLAAGIGLAILGAYLKARRGGSEPTQYPYSPEELED